MNMPFIAEPCFRAAPKGKPGVAARLAGMQ
jgi:hypothetical protein